MAKRGSITGGTSEVGVGIRIEMFHPDGKKIVLRRGAVGRIRSSVASYLLSVLIHQIPEDTGQLKNSYRRLVGLGLIGPGGEMRSEGRITNAQLASILARRGFLRLTITGAMRRQAIVIAKRELRRSAGGPIRFKARVHLT